MTSMVCILCLYTVIDDMHVDDMHVYTPRSCACIHLDHVHVYRGVERDRKRVEGRGEELGGERERGEDDAVRRDSCRCV